MRDFDYQYGTHVMFGDGRAMESLASQTDAMGDTVLLAYGGAICRNGTYEEVRRVLEGAGKRVVDFGGIMPNPTYAKVQAGAELVRREGVDFILAVGGGSVIDCAKVVSAQARSDRDLWTLEFEEGGTPTDFVPLGAVLTASGTGSEMNAGGVITNEAVGIKRGMVGVKPTFAILDPQLTRTVPRMQVMSGAFDSLSHCMETFLGSSDEDNPSDDALLGIMRNIVTNMRRLVADIDDMQARGNLIWDSAMAENGILMVGRDTGFQVHQMEHQLGAFTDCNHGQGLAVIHPAYYRHILADAPERFGRMARFVFGVEGAEAFVSELEGLIRDCGLPTRLGELRSTVPIDDGLLQRVARTCRIIETVPRVLDRDEVLQILRESL